MSLDHLAASLANWTLAAPYYCLRARPTPQMAMIAVEEEQLSLQIRMALHNCQEGLDSTAVSIFVDIVVELTNSAVFVNSTNTSTKIETAMLSKRFEH